MTQPLYVMKMSLFRRGRGFSASSWARRPGPVGVSHEHKGVKVLQGVQDGLDDVAAAARLALALAWAEKGRRLSNGGRPGAALVFCSGEGVPARRAACPLQHWRTIPWEGGEAGRRHNKKGGARGGGVTEGDGQAGLRGRAAMRRARLAS